MNRIVLIEDEKAAQENLLFYLNKIIPEVEVVACIDSVRDAVSFFKAQPDVDLVFMDIELADGHAFQIVEQVAIQQPIIFTTAYDRYAIEAFKVNGLAYVLKPYLEEDLRQAWQKYQTGFGGALIRNDYLQLLSTFQQFQKPVYKSSLLVYDKDKILPVEVSSLVYFYIDVGIVKGVRNDKETYVLDESLEDLSKELNPAQFYRANRQFIVNRNYIVDLSVYFNGRLLVNTNPKSVDKILISKAKVPNFKQWLQALD